MEEKVIGGEDYKNKEQRLLLTVDSSFKSSMKRQRVCLFYEMAVLVKMLSEWNFPVKTTFFFAFLFNIHTFFLSFAFFLYNLIFFCFLVPKQNLP